MSSSVCNHNEWVVYSSTDPAQQIHIRCKVCYRDVYFETKEAFEAAVPTSHVVGTAEEAPKRILHVRNVPNGMSPSEVRQAFTSCGFRGVQFSTVVPERRHAHVEFADAEEAARCVEKGSVVAPNGMSMYVAYAKRQHSLSARTLMLTLTRERCGTAAPLIFTPYLLYQMVIPLGVVTKVLLLSPSQAPMPQIRGLVQFETVDVAQFVLSQLHGSHVMFGEHDVVSVSCQTSTCDEIRNTANTPTCIVIADELRPFVHKACAPLPRDTLGQVRKRERE